MGVRQGCPLSPTLFGLFFDGLHDHLHSCASASGIQLRSGRWVSSLVYADDIVLLSWSASGLQVLLDSMNQFCVGLGLVISTTKTEVVVFNGPGRHLRLPRHRRVCRLCHTGALGDERHMLLECPALADLRDEYSPLVAECSGVMARLVWARNQPMVSRYIIACLDRMSC